MDTREQRLEHAAREHAAAILPSIDPDPSVRRVSPTLYAVSWWYDGCHVVCYFTETATLPTRAMIDDASGTYARFWILNTRTRRLEYASESRLLLGRFTYRDATLAD